MRIPPQAAPVTDADVAAGRVAERHAQSAAEHGSVFASTVPGDWLAGPCVVLVGSDALAAATGEAHAALSSEEGWAPLLGARLGRAVINADDPQHAQDRRRWSGAFAPAQIEAFLPAMRALVARRVEGWAMQGEFDVHPATRELAFAAIATTLGGFADDAALARVLSLFTAMLEPTRAGERDLDRHQRVAPLRDELESLLRAHIAGRTNSDATGLPGHLRRQAPELSGDALLAHLNVLLVTGHETSASVLAWLVHHASLPRWADWLREEFDAIGEPVEGLPLSRIEDLPRLDAFVREAGRLHPPLICAPRVSTRDVVIAGVTIPARSRVVLGYGGTNVLASAYANPLAFDPQRWMGTSLPRPATFGSGHRLCMGARFASLELKTFVLHLVSNYDIERGERTGHAAPVNAGFWNARPGGTLRVALRPRSIADRPH